VSDTPNTPEAVDTPEVAKAPETVAAPEPPKAKKHSFARQAVEFVLTIAIAFLVAQSVRTWVIQPYVVPTGSMLPTIQLGDQVLANKFIYRFRTPTPGDIVVFDNPMPEPGEDTLIKRVIAVGGQTVDLKDGSVVVDGKPLIEPYTYGQPSNRLEDSKIVFPVDIPPGYVWLMGDNRGSSKDSRYFGAVSVSAIHGEAFFTYWPLGRLGPLD
jgi:signal peptidase I